MLSKLHLQLQIRFKLLRRSLFTGVCSFIVLSFLFGTAAFAGRYTDQEIKNFLTLTIIKLDLSAAACSGYASFDTALINQKLKQYAKNGNGVVPSEVLDRRVKELRAELGGMSAAESQVKCADLLRASIDEYSAIRAVFLHRMLDKGIPPPLIGLESLSVQ